jgi:hypothetical protein
VVILGPGPGGALHSVFGVGRWPVAILLVGVQLDELLRKDVRGAK